MAGEGEEEERKNGAQEGDGAGMLLLAHIAEVVEARNLEHLGKGKKRKDADAEAEHTAGEQDGIQDVDGSKRSKLEEHTVEAELFSFLTPSDLRLTAQALIDTKVSHFKCNVNGCQKDYRSHTALAKHRRDKHMEWAKHQAHGAEEECSLQAECDDKHCGWEHRCDLEVDCDGKRPHCHEGIQWPPKEKSVFICPEPTCAHSAGQVQSLRYHYLRTHGGQDRFCCSNCGRSFAMKTDLNRHKTSCEHGFSCQCGKLLRTLEGLETHKRIFHRQEVSSADVAGGGHGRAPLESEHGGHGHAHGHEHAHAHEHAHGEREASCSHAGCGGGGGGGAGAVVPALEAKEGRMAAHAGGASGEGARAQGEGKGKRGEDAVLRAFLAPSDLFVCEERMGWCCDRVASTEQATSPQACASTPDEQGTYVCGFKACIRKVASLAELALHRKVAHPDWPTDASWVGSYNFDEGDLQRLQDFRVFCSRYSEGCKESFTSIENLRAHVLNNHKDPSCPCPHEHSHTHGSDALGQ